jgi:hypothetical protein
MTLYIRRVIVENFRNLASRCTASTSAPSARSRSKANPSTPGCSDPTALGWMVWEILPVLT